MRAHLPLLVLLSFASAATALQAQQITHPEVLAGRWEAPDGHGGSIGMNITLDTAIPRAAALSASAKQTIINFEVAIYQRVHADVPPLGFNVFSISSGGATWDGHHLRIDTPGSLGVPPIHVRLTWRPKTAEWTGTFQRAGLHAATLRRPTHVPPSAWSGTWVDTEGGANTCLHIAQDADGNFTAWSDSLQLPDRIVYPARYPVPSTLPQFYGAIATAHLTASTRLDLVLYAYSAICCSHPLSVTLARGGSLLNGVWPAGPNQDPRTSVWKREAGDSCRLDADRLKERMPLCPVSK